MELHVKLKRVKRALVECSKIEFGNIIIKKATMNDIIYVKETQFELDPSPKNRSHLKKAEADLRKLLKLKEEFWK